MYKLRDFVGFLLKKLWVFLTTPLEKMRRAEDEQRAKVVTAFFLFCTVAITIDQMVAGNTPSLALWILLGGYFLARTRWYKIATIILIVILTVPSYLIVVKLPDPEPYRVFAALVWVILPLLLVSLIFSVRAAILIYTFNIAAILALPFLYSELSFRTIGEALGFFILTSLVILIVMIERIKLENIRQAELRQSQERFYKIFHTSPDAISISELENGRIIDINNSFSSMLGYAPDECISRTSIELNMYVNPTDRFEMVRLLKEHSEINEYEFHLRHKDGTQFIASASVSPIELDGKACLIWMARDVTIQKQKEAQREKLLKELEQAVREKIQIELALRQSENIYRRAIMAAGAVPYVFDPATRTLRFLGEGILSLTGYSASELMSLDQWNTVELEGLPRGNLAHLTLEEANRITNEDISIPWECDFRILTRDGQTRWIADTSVRGFDETGEHIVAIGIKQDITERKQSEIERESLIKELEIRNAEMERFLYAASHDLKSPVVTIKGFLGLLKKDLEEDRQDKVQKDFERIAEAADKMGILLSELLELSRIGRIINPSEEIDLVKLAHETMETVDGRIRAKNITTHISPNLPKIHGDRVRLGEVLENLIDNAAKYMGDQPNPVIEIGSREEKGGQIIIVKDNGIGIEEQYQTKIFGLFEKLNPTSEGTGIGLALIKRIIEVHGGRIWVESEGVGKGSKFCFTIPDEKQSINSINL